MGNGQGLKGKTIAFDIETSGLAGELTIEMIEDAAIKSMANFGRNPIIMIPPGMITTMDWHTFPQYAGTPWSQTPGLTKREKAVAGLHTTLAKLDVVEIDHKMFIKTKKRLKRAKWAQYNRKS